MTSHNNTASSGRMRYLALAAVATTATAACVYAARRFFLGPSSPPKGRLIVRGDASNIGALKDQFELDKTLWNLRSHFDVDFVEGAPVADVDSSGAAASKQKTTTTTFELIRAVASCRGGASVLLGAVDGNLRHRRSVLVPPYIVRWLRWEAQQQEKKVLEGASTAAATPVGLTSAGSFPSAEYVMPPPKARSGDVLESGAVAGAVPDTRRRRTVEERVMRVALDVLAPLTAAARVKPSSASNSPQRSNSPAPSTPNAPLTESNLPYDTFTADAACSDAVIRANIATEFSSRNGASEYVAALLYLMDVAACNGERLPAARRVADEAAARIVQQHNGRFDSIKSALEPILGTTVEVTSEEHLVEVLLRHANTIGSYAINHFGSSGGGALAAGSADRTLTNLLDAGQDTVAFLAFPMCSYGAVFLLREIYDTVLAQYGSWRMEGFTALNAKLWDRAASKIPPSSWSRLFRSMNRSRTGDISYHEYCSHFAKKVSACGDDFDPDLALVLSLARLRFNHLLFFSRNIEWPGRSFWFDALVDAHDNRE